VLPDGCVIDESWDIMQWALHRHDPDGWLGTDDRYIEAAIPLVNENDTSFKHNLDRYKYPDRYPAHPQSDYRKQAKVFLLNMESRLSKSSYLLGDEFSIADAALFPFIRQFAAVDKDWFAQAPYASLQRWLKDIRGSQGFATIMKKHAIWHPGDPPVIMSHGTDSPEIQ